jgi:signal transduction histidine kinase
VTEALRLLQYGVAAGFVAVGILTLFDWLREREPARGFLAVAIGMLAVVAAVGRVQDVAGQLPALRVVALIAFLASGYGLLRFRGCFIPLGSTAHRLALAAFALAALLGTASILPPASGAPGIGMAALLGVVAVWVVFVGEPIVRFWVASRGRPRVQRARLRALAAGFGGIVAILVVDVTAGQAVTSLPGQVGLQLIALAIVPLLYVSFSPPGWLRREWRAAEQDELRKAVQDLLLFSPDRQTLAERAVDWASRLVGADAALIVDADGSVLAARGVSRVEAQRMLEGLDRSRVNRIVTLKGEPRQAAIVIGLPLAPGPGALVALAGPFTPVFGTDELEWLQQYSSSITVGLDRVVLTERISALERTKTQFLNLASHELRGPITVLRGYLSMAEKGSLGRPPAQLARVLPVLVAKTEEMNTLVEQMLEAARLEEGRIELRSERVDLRELAARAIEMVRPLADEKHPLVLKSPDREVPVVVDVERISTIISNLLDNAVKYSPSGGEVLCTVRRRADVGEVRVSDRGIGIAPADLPRLFTRFGRIASQEGSYIRGTGLGLYLSRELARLHGGDITVESKPGVGSTFVLAVPLVKGSGTA